MTARKLITIPLHFLVATTSTTTAFQIRYCNRGFCYTKSCDDNVIIAPGKNARAHYSYVRRDSHNMLLASSLLEVQQGQSIEGDGPYEVCTDSIGHVVDCNLVKIIDGYDGELNDAEAVESWSREQKQKQWRSTHREARAEEQVSATVAVGDCMRREDEVVVRESRWPHPGHCFSLEGAIFDCNLLETLRDGKVLVEDQRVGGFLIIQQRDFSMKRLSREPMNAPAIVTSSGAGDPTEDWRTIAYLSLEGF